jgi:hypothetical protein
MKVRLDGNDLRSPRLINCVDIVVSTTLSAMHVPTSPSPCPAYAPYLQKGGTCVVVPRQIGCNEPAQQLLAEWRARVEV